MDYDGELVPLDDRQALREALAARAAAASPRASDPGSGAPRGGKVDES